MTVIRKVFIVAAKRTPFGSFGGKLSKISPTQLALIASKAAIEAGKVPSAHIDSVIMGNILQCSQDAIYLARHVGLYAGVPISSTALTINRLCGSGFQSVINGTQEIALGESELVLTGGTENMSQAPFVSFEARWGFKLGNTLQFQDSLWSGLTDTYCNLPMALTAENLAEKYKITREDCDRYSMQTQQRWTDANLRGAFKEELCPVQVKCKKGLEEFIQDEHPKISDMDQLGNLKPVFKKNGVVTAGNASGICDGGGAVILASEEAISKHNLTPLARVAGYSISGVEPSIMGIGPVASIKGLLKKTGKKLEQIDIIDINEAFAAQYLAVAKELGLPSEKTNLCGGAIALGHPLAASGSRITAHLVHQLRIQQKKLAIGSACIGGGQGIALLIENVD